MKSESIYSFTVEETSSMRLDKYLATIHPEYSRAFYQKHILDKKVLINGNIHTKVSSRLLEGDIVTIHIQQQEDLLNLTPEAIPLQKIYEDAMILVINKPQGIVVHPAPGHYSGTIVHALLYEIGERIKEEFPEEPWRPGIIHRLDKDTSGLLITAKTRQAKKIYGELFSKKLLKKTYLAICVGKPPNTTISTNLARHQYHRKEISVTTEGKEAITHCQVLAYNGKLSLTLLSPETGRTHQLRVHMKHLCTPILGDPVYGSSTSNRGYGLDKQQLHAYSLDFIHPETRKPLKLTVAPPNDMKTLILKEFQDSTIINKKFLDLLLK
ncbi:RluA family pseudouridine synthase [Chlamydia sp. 17-3921]|uniref:RluA family pseudouridine synthase n=1 Tax=Chlamydia sp. 17-3921 TaxID=2675798 RepID=UPI00191B3B6C|nr:RluA family pseudouridine synthase [Chlamydia sp. 17-3921]